MRWMHTLAGAGAVAILFGATAFGAPKKSTSTPSNSAAAPNEERLIKNSGYTGWRLKWANINQIGDRNLCAGLNFYSLQKQIAMGKQIAQQVMQSSRMVTDPVVDNYINKVGQNIVRNSDARIPYTFQVVDSNVVNAFSLPGGFVFVNSGLILRASDEAELAGVMAHETAHVAACHGAKQETKADITQIAMIPLAIMLPYGWAGYGIYEGVNAAIPLAFLKFSRTDEAQADFLGTEYMYKAGYDPNAMISFFEKIEAEDKRLPGTISPIFATHPPTPERMLWIQHEIATILPPRPEYLVDTSQFEAVKHRLALYEADHRIQKNKNAPTLKNKTTGKKPNDKPPVLKRRNPNNPNDP